VGAAIGLLSAGLALGVSELSAALFGAGSSPILAVGGVTVDATPEWLKDFAIRTFGESDKAVLLGGIGVVVAAVAVVVGIASMRRPRFGVVALMALGAAGAIAAVSRPVNDLVDAIPSLLGMGAGLLVFDRLRRAAGLVEEDRDPPRAPVESFERRRFLLTGASVAGLAVVTGGLGRMLIRRASADASRAAVSIPPVADTGAPTPSGADLGIDGVTPFITPNERFYRVDTALFVPAIAAEDWSLRVHGMVDREMTLDLGDLLARPLSERDITLTCVSNPVGGRYIGNARWTGARLDDLLREAGVAPEATQIVTRSTDGFTIGTPTAVVMDGRDSMLAVAMNGEPLPLEHGFPVRMIVPGLYGYVSAMKWIVDMELTTLDAYDAYWIQRGWAKEAPIKTHSRIDKPSSGARLAAGEVSIAGIAWAQRVGIGAVEVRIDGGPWLEATLAEEDTIDTWRQWVYPWEAPPGDHSIEVRATNADGETQIEERTEPFPDGATGYHRILVEAG
jgi:DMSO/TMAO reductase YedYZ molybdopterin-dependent catalytic subunit